jgi:hypothetical protein
MSRGALVSALALSWALLLGGCAHAPSNDHALALRLAGTYQLAPDLQVDGTLVGGISGMDYDAARDEWWLASDDRGQHAPARLYRARMTFKPDGIETVALSTAVILHQPDGARYPAWGTPGVSADIESLRIDPRDGAIWFASEGDRKARVPSFVRRVDVDGRHLGELPYPAALQIQPDCECGGRSNQGMEGMAFTPDSAALWLAMEAPPVQDGPPPRWEQGQGQGALTRISLVARDGAMLAQYAYPLDVAPAPAFDGAFVDNGISEILALDNRRLLVLERAGRQRESKHFDFNVRLYEVDLASASRLDPELPLGQRPSAPRPAVKRLLFDSARLPPGWSDNYEAMAWGPLLENGNRTLIIASDNNFNGGPTRFLLFDVGTPTAPRRNQGTAGE